MILIIFQGLNPLQALRENGSLGQEGFKERIQEYRSAHFQYS
jgi:hypothetical protein